MNEMSPEKWRRVEDEMFFRNGPLFRGYVCFYVGVILSVLKRNAEFMTPKWQVNSVATIWMRTGCVKGRVIH